MANILCPNCGREAEVKTTKSENGWVTVGVRFPCKCRPFIPSPDGPQSIEVPAVVQKNTQNF